MVSGGHQADEPAATTQEGADHQRDLGDEGKQKLQHSELPGQVSCLKTRTLLLKFKCFAVVKETVNVHSPYDKILRLCCQTGNPKSKIFSF